MRTTHRRRVIGVFLAQLDDAYQDAVWKGIEVRARRRGVGVVCFIGRRIASPAVSEAAFNVAYRIADARTLDGLAVISSAIATFLDAERLERILAPWGRIPLVSVGVPVEGVAGVTVDGSEGLATVIRHLIRDHGRTRFALIKGPSGHPEADERARVFRAVLDEAGLRFDERLEAPGTFVRESGALAARRLIDSGVPFDALVCLNDRMALGAMDVLREARIRVPRDVAVTGFDGVEEGRYVTPPLTTVVQPLDELGSAAVDTLIDLIEGSPPESRALRCAPAIRQSCGCPPPLGAVEGAGDPPCGATAEELEAMRELEAYTRGGDAGVFLAALNRALTTTTLDGREPSRWNDYLTVVRQRAGVMEEGGAARASMLEAARVLIGETSSRFQAARRVEAEERLNVLHTTIASLAGAFEMPVMLASLEAGLERLGIGVCYLALFCGGEGGREGWSRLVMAPREGGRSLIPPGGLRFRTTGLLPSRFGRAWREGSWVLEPLVFQDEPLGYMLLPGGAEEPAVYLTIAEQVASALKGALLLEQVRTHERRLESEVTRRTAELTRANSELTREVERRMRLEREVTQISNSTMLRIGQDLHDDLCQHLAGIAMLVSVLRGELARSGSSAVGSIDQIGGLLEDSIARAKQIARGLYPAGLEEHGLAAAVEELVGAARRNYSAAIDFRASPGFRLPDTNRALQVYRIIQEALTNALRHSGSDRIEVRLHENGARLGPEAREDAFLVAEVTDYGVGLPSSMPDEGMGLRIMRYRAEAAGAEIRFERLSPGTRVSCRIGLEQGAR